MAFRGLAIAIAIAGVVDPAIARRVTAPLSVEFRLPSSSHPDFDRARHLRDGLVEALGARSSIDGGAAPHAIVVIGDGRIGDVGGARVFSMPIPTARPDIRVVGIEVPRRTVIGQAVVVGASLRGAGAGGRTSTVRLELRGAVLSSVDHSWKTDDERFDANLVFTPPGPGVHRVRISVETDGLPTIIADAVVVVRGERIRVLVHEARPTWPVTFVRRSLEADALFEVHSSVRSSRSVGTFSSGAPAALSRLDLDRYDALVLGALEELREPDLSTIDRFLAERGGALILVPDRQIPPAVRRRLDLPEVEEVLLEKPVAVQGSGVSLEVSEFLLSSSARLQPLATMRQGRSERTVIGALRRGEGRIVVSGALDAWRHRARTSNVFDASWRGLVADSALGSPPKVDVRIEPAIARPGDTMKVSVAVRPTEFRRNGETIDVPPVTAWLAGEDGRRDPIRLWPGGPVGSFEGAFDAPSTGRFILSVSIPGATTESALLVAEDIVHPDAGISGAPAHAAAASGGAVVDDPGELARVLKALDTGTHDAVSRPLRSAWWIVPFTVLLVGEWALRRRSGLK